jgi:hypothetical protein
MKITISNFPETISHVGEMAQVFENQKFQQSLIDAVEVIRQNAASRVHSVTGRTVQAMVVRPGRGRYLSAYLKIDLDIASVLWKGRRFPYPYSVEYGHKGKHSAPPHPFFAPAVKDSRSTVVQIVKTALLDILKPYMGSSSIGGEFR